MKQRIISAALAAFISAGLFSAPAQEIIGSSAVVYAASAVSAPSVSRKPGSYTSSASLSVKLTTSTPGAVIYYSTGSSYKKYTKAIKLTKNTTLKCYAEKDGVKSAVKAYKYKLCPKVTFSPEEGEFDDALPVKLSSKASGVTYYYTLDGKKPTTSSRKYTSSGIKIERTSTLRVMAVKSRWTSKYYTKEYTISGSSDLSGESILDDYKSKYAYNTLTSSQKQVYAKLFEAAAAHADKADLTGINVTTSEIDDIYWAFDYDNPQFFWLANGYRYTTRNGRVIGITMVYSRTVSEMNNIKPKFEAAAQKIIDKALQEDDLFERVKVLHDAITDMTEYTLSGPSYISEADGPLVYGKALCEGYSKAFMYLCQSVGIPCICVAGTGNGEKHMWNMLQLDGEWYNMDVTWDDDGDYNYFCIPTSQLTIDHRFNNPFTVPSATATKYTYTSAMGFTVYNTLNEAYNGLVEQASANWGNGEYTTTIYVKDGLMNSLIRKIKSSTFISDLRANGCNARSWSANYSDRAITITLS